MIGTTKFFVKACWPIATRIALKETLTRNSHYATISKIPIPKFVSSPSIASINKEFSLNFKSLEPRKSLKNQSCRESRLNFDFLKNYQRTFMFRRKDKPKNHGKRIPKLILIQNPFSWLMVKIDFTVLRHVWDPQFQEKEFKFGTKQAISRVTEVISKGQLGDLNGLLTKAARLSLLRELDHNWSEKQRHLLFLQFEDIQISSPRKVYFIRIAGTVLFTFVVSHNLENADKKFCDVDMAFLALKWVPINSIDALLFTEIFARFHRDYTPHSIPEWTIAYFKVTRFEVLRR